MKTKLLLVIAFAIIFLTDNYAQPAFIEKGIIEYEMKSNIKRNMNGESFWEQMLQDKLPEFKVGYFTLAFDGRKSLFKFDRWQNKALLPAFLRMNDEETFYYKDFDNNNFFYNKAMWGGSFPLVDSLPNLKWQLGNETREIAGFNCKKAVTVLFDSVYIFAFYTDEIISTAGPISIHGLPGAIMGITIPRLYTSYVATKVTVAGVNNVTPPKAPAKPMSLARYMQFLTDETKDWFRWDNDAENRKKGQEKFYWQMLL